MRRVFGPRTVFEAAFLVGVPVVALEIGARWPAIVAAYQGYAGYQKRTQRDIPVVICEPRPV